MTTPTIEVEAPRLGDASEAVVKIMSEEEIASWRQAQGSRVLCSKGRYWLEKPAGFFYAVHPLARMSAAEAVRPAPLCWGFRATLADAGAANGSMPLHHLDGVQGYDLQSLSSRQRNKLRNCWKRVDLVEFLSPEPLLKEGFRVFLSARQRNGYGDRRFRSEAEFRREIEGMFHPRRGLILGAMIDGVLQGFLSGYAVGKVAYIEDAFHASEGLSSHLGLGLFFAWMQACRRAGVEEMVHGLHARENPGLDSYKESLGFRVLKVPARSWFLPLTGDCIRLLRPHAHYRLTGLD